jgi:uncharacterized protein (TIGR03437 family)
MGRLVALWLSVAVLGAVAAPKRVLYITHSAGFRHDSILASRQAMETIAAQSGGALEVVASEDLSLLSAENLRHFDVLFFFTSGELQLSDSQRQDFLAFVREGKGFGGAHSATDTLYGWLEYGELIGGYFDGHPWVQEVTVDVEDPDHPATRHLAPSFRLLEEIYQFRSFSRDRVRVLQTLDTSTVNLQAPGVTRTDGDFALTWVRNYGQGRVFYTAFGHFDETWRDAGFRTMLRNALLWLAGEIPGEAAPRSASPAVSAGGVVNAASFTPAPQNFVAPGSLISIFGSQLTSGSTLSAASLPLPTRLAGTTVQVNGAPIPLIYASPGQINAQLPFELNPAEPAALRVASVNRTSAPEALRVQSAAPGIFAVLSLGRPAGAPISIFATGLGEVAPPLPSGAGAPAAPLSRTTKEPVVTVGGQRASVLFSGLAPLFAGLYQVDAVIPAGVNPGPAEVVLEIEDRRSNTVSITVGP